jgi:hypothetical protein
MSRARHCAAAAALVAGCSDPTYALSPKFVPIVQSYVVWRIDGKDVAVDGAQDVLGPDLEARRTARNRLAVASQAAEDFACAANDVRVEDRDSVEHALFVAHGCGRRGVYREVREIEQAASNQPVITRVRFLNITSTGASPLPEPLRVWRSLLVQGARDLGCAEDQVVPEFVWDQVGYRRAWLPTFPVVEGCGKRAVYDRHRWPPFCDPTIFAIEP